MAKPISAQEAIVKINEMKRLGCSQEELVECVLKDFPKYKNDLYPHVFKHVFHVSSDAIGAWGDDAKYFATATFKAFMPHRHYKRIFPELEEESVLQCKYFFEARYTAIIDTKITTFNFNGELQFSRIFQISGLKTYSLPPYLDLIPEASEQQAN